MVDCTWSVVYRNGRFYRDNTDVSDIDEMTITINPLRKIDPIQPFRDRVSHQSISRTEIDHSGNLPIESPEPTDSRSSFALMPWIAHHQALWLKSSEYRTTTLSRISNHPGPSDALVAMPFPFSPKSSPSPAHTQASRIPIPQTRHGPRHSLPQSQIPIPQSRSLIPLPKTTPTKIVPSSGPRTSFLSPKAIWSPSSRPFGSPGSPSTPRPVSISLVWGVIISRY